MKQQIKTIISDCDIDFMDYHLDLKDEKLIGKAKVQKPVTTHAEAFAFKKYLKPKYENAFLFRE